MRICTERKKFKKNKQIQWKKTECYGKNEKKNNAEEEWRKNALGTLSRHANKILGEFSELNFNHSNR